MGHHGGRTVATNRPSLKHRRWLAGRISAPSLNYTFAGEHDQSKFANPWPWQVDAHRTHRAGGEGRTITSRATPNVFSGSTSLVANTCAFAQDDAEQNVMGIGDSTSAVCESDGDWTKMEATAAVLEDREGAPLPRCTQRNGQVWNEEILDGA